ncbi:MAG: VanZ family protein [Chloroflexota bacterium]
MSSINLGFSKNPILRWTPAVLMMLVIFLFSARPSTDVIFSLFNRVVYKGGHVIGYALLALSYWRAFGFRDDKRWLAWLMALLYAVTDEYHQSFVPGRHAIAFDILVYDNIGALTSLWLAGRFMKQKQPASQSLVVEQDTSKANS